MLRLRGLVSIWCVVLGGVLTTAACAADAYTSPAEAGIDFTIQGEYAGVLESDGMRWGAQIIALGDGKFQTMGYPGGLPGDGWDRGDDKNQLEGQLVGQSAVFQADSFRLEVDGNVMKVVDSDNAVLGELKKVERKSPTLGAKAPEGGIVLFDGTSVEGWENGKLLDGGLLGATNCESRETFDDHQLHVEFRTPFMPAARGQGRGNSGVYVQGRYEVQVLDSFGLDGKDNECGGIYSVSEPKVNMCFPPLSWQTYDIDFTSARYDADGNKTANAKITIKHNGVVIHENLELPAATPGRHREGPEPQGLFLQDHGNPVAFRNVWAVKK